MGEVGCEQYFHVKAGLPNVGLDSGFDCHHVSDKELVSIFEEKVSDKGYCCDGVTLEKVKSRVWELYPAIWQTPKLPEGHHILESFAKAVDFEVCHYYAMNWAKYAEDRWRGKKPEGGDEREVLFRTPDQNDTYFEIISSSLQAKIAEGEKECQSAVADHCVAFERLGVPAITFNAIDAITFTVHCCSLYKQGFPEMDLVIASCVYPYHSWCAPVQTSLPDTCTRCEEQFLEKWLDNFGYFKCEGPANAGSASDTVEGEKKRRHLNSDIGGWNYTRKEKSSPTCRRKSK